MSGRLDEAAALRELIDRLEAVVEGSAEAVALLAAARDAGLNPVALLSLLAEHRLTPEERHRAAVDLDRYRVLLGDETPDAAVERVLHAAASSSSSR